MVAARAVRAVAESRDTACGVDSCLERQVKPERRSTAVIARDFFGLTWWRHGHYTSLHFTLRFARLVPAIRTQYEQILMPGQEVGDALALAHAQCGLARSQQTLHLLLLLSPIAARRDDGRATRTAAT